MSSDSHHDDHPDHEHDAHEQDGHDNADDEHDGHENDDHEHDDQEAEPVTDRVHDTSWSANLEKPQHADDRELVVSQAVDAVEHTVPGNHVNLVTHGDHGHPEEYLFEELSAVLEDDVEWEYVEQCGCGGHVTRVHVV